MTAQTLEAPAATVCDTVFPGMIDSYTADGASRLCDARRTVLGCGGCACAALNELATTDPAARADLGFQVNATLNRGGAL